MGRRQTLRDLKAQGDQFAGVDRPSSQKFSKALPRAEFHDDERPFFELSHIVDRADVGMIQMRCRPGFLLEPAPGGRVRQQTLGQELDGDRPAEANITGRIDDPHAAGPQAIDDLVVGHPLTQQRGIRIFRQGMRQETAGAESPRRLRVEIETTNRAGAALSHLPEFPPRSTYQLSASIR